eukprot:c20769_g1_i1.p5 GENE.c20769_g1_i1~~c20769_g1_i1.p5  ORF type:complete len:113 (-),score=19.06 c20769_g1_i1:665-1003(-)
MAFAMAQLKSSRREGAGGIIWSATDRHGSEDLDDPVGVSHDVGQMGSSWDVGGVEEWANESLVLPPDPESHKDKVGQSDSGKERYFDLGSIEVVTAASAQTQGAGSFRDRLE